MWVEGEKSITGQFSQDLTQKQPGCFCGGELQRAAAPMHLRIIPGKKKASAVAGTLSLCSVAVIGAKAQNEMW